MNGQEDTGGAHGDLHPSLARLRVRYEQVLDDLACGRITAETARELLDDLWARDDLGVLWRINPVSGAWERHDGDGRLVPDDPPGYGTLVPPPAQLSTGVPAASEARISHRDVAIPNPVDAGDPVTVVVGGRVPDSGGFGDRRRSGPPHRTLVWVVVVAALVVAAFVAGLRGSTGGAGDGRDPGAPTTVTGVSDAPDPGPGG